MGGQIAEEGGSFGDIREGVADVAGTEIAVDGLGVFDFRVGGCQSVTDESEEAVERSAFSDGDVVDLVKGGGVCGGGGENIGLDDVADEAEVAAGFAITVDENGFVVEQAGDPFGNDGGVGSVGILAGTEDIKVAEADGLEAVGFGKDIGVQFVHVLCHRVGRQGAADFVFDLGEVRMVTVSRAGSRVDEAGDAGIAGGHEHIEKA